MAEVEVIKAVDGPILRKRDYEGNPVVITRQRVAAYVRVSTDGDEQLESFQSQKQYYQDKISENRDWVMVGIYADEAINITNHHKPAPPESHRGYSATCADRLPHRAALRCC